MSLSVPFVLRNSSTCFKSRIHDNFNIHLMKMMWPRERENMLPEGQWPKRWMANERQVDLGEGGLIVSGKIWQRKD